MGKSDNLHDFFLDLANAIRTKEGSTEPIYPRDMARRVAALGGATIDTAPRKTLKATLVDIANAIRVVEGSSGLINPQDMSERIMLFVTMKPYTEVEYIESTGTQYIDTAYTPNDTTEIELGVSGITSSSFAISSGTWFIGARLGYLNRAYGFYYNPSQQNFYYAFGNNMPSAKYTTLYNAYKTIKTNATGLYVDGTKVVGATVSTFTAPVSLSLFGLNNNGSTISFTNFKMHYCKIWDNGTLVRDFIPVLDYNNVACLYDKVSNNFFCNQGSGAFLHGKILNEYTPVEYIESTGAQWIDTGYSINTATDTVEFVFQNVGTTIYKWIMGEHDDRARFGVGSGDGIGKRNVAYGATTYKVADAQIFNSQHIFISNESGVFLDGTKIANFASFASTSSIYLFNLNLNSVNYCGSAKVWSYKHYRNGILIRDFIPVLDKDDVACMYDKVSGEFFYNKGDGEFIAGNIKE